MTRSTRLLAKVKVTLCVLTAVLCGCGGDDPAGGGGSGGTSGGTSGSGGATSSGTSGSGGASSSGAFLEASGTVNGVALSVSCDAAYYEQPYYGGFLQCQKASGQHGIQCQSEQADAHGFKGLANISLTFIDGEISLGATDFTALTASAGAKVTGTLDTGVGLSSDTANVVTNSATFDSYEAYVGASGSFTASWTDDGGHYADISGSFDYLCRE